MILLIVTVPHLVSVPREAVMLSTHSYICASVIPPTHPLTHIPLPPRPHSIPCLAACFCAHGLFSPTNVRNEGDRFDPIVPSNRPERSSVHPRPSTASLAGATLTVTVADASPPQTIISATTAVPPRLIYEKITNWEEYKRRKLLEISWAIIGQFLENS